ncbi:redox-sensitive transcriptional activator SoxR [Thalassotalea ganghwensis]
MLEEANLTVGVVAKRCGVKVSTLHFYENKGLIRSWRNQGNQRRYKREVLRRIAIIQAAQKMGITLKEIAVAFDQLPDKRAPDKDDWSQLSRSWQVELDKKINAMTRLRDYLNGCIGCGCLSMQRCPIYNPDDCLGEEHSGAVILEQDNVPD